MRPLLILMLTLAGFTASPTRGADHGAPATPVGQYVDLSPVALPIVWEGRLINYVFASVRVNLAGSANAMAIREKEPYFRDALVKLGHRRPFTRLDDFTRLDEAALRTAMMAEAVKIAGARSVTGVVVTNQQPQRRAGLPRPPRAPTAS